MLFVHARSNTVVGVDSVTEHGVGCRPISAVLRIKECVPLGAVGDNDGSADTIVPDLERFGVTTDLTSNVR